jgi:hypothetical protein
MQIFQIAGVFILIAAMVYFLGRLLYMVIGGMGAVRKATAAFDKQLRQELAELSVEGLRERLLRNPYLSSLRNNANVQNFYARVAAGDEAALVRELSKARFYKMLVGAEQSLDIVGRPEAVDNIDEIWTILQELAARSSPRESSDQR